MLKGAVARRYAEAVFDLGVEQGTLDRWMSDLHLIAEAFSNRHLSFILREPKIPFARKEAVVRDLLEQRLQTQSLALAVLLVERELVNLAPKIADAFEKKLNDYRGEATAIVTSAVPLPEQQQQQVAAYLQQITGKQRIYLHTRVNPDILGGIVAQIGDTLIDGSVRRRLKLMRDQIIRGTLGGSEDGGVAATLGTGPGGTGSGGNGTGSGGDGTGSGGPATPASGGASTPPTARPPAAKPPAPKGKQQGNKPGNGTRPKR
jgi:F-type H+-transporting ATPase subunit delta